MMEKPIVLVVMDGVGKGDGGPGDAVKNAQTPTLDHLWETCPHTYLKAHGTAVGLSTDEDMGNSEVGHNALGCGQIYSQGAKLVAESIETGSLYESETWKKLIANAQDKALHFLGLLSDGNVHSNISHLIAMLRKAKEQGVRKAYCHVLLDGRDVPATSALEYIQQLEDVLAELNTQGCDYAIASGGGRMQITIDENRLRPHRLRIPSMERIGGEGGDRHSRGHRPLLPWRHRHRPRMDRLAAAARADGDSVDGPATEERAFFIRPDRLLSIRGDGDPPRPFLGHHAHERSMMLVHRDSMFHRIE